VVASSPTVLKRWIAFELRKLREGAGISRERAAASIRGSVTNIGHMEVGRSLPGPLELERLLELYGVAERIEFWLELRQRAKKGRDWWIGFGDAVPDYFTLFLGMEHSAAQVESFDAQVVPGLFQTADYARAVFRALRPELGEAEIDRQVDLRLARQREVLDPESPPLLWRIIAEPALRWEIGGRDTLRAQLGSLLELAERPDIELQVLPFSAGAHVGVDGAFSVLTFPAELESDSGVVFAETRVQGYYYEESEQITRYRNALSRLRVQAISPADTPAHIHRLAKEL
jgi:hypothetical protein